jgi:hypothetical protein
MEAIHQIEESQQDMLPFIDIYEPSTGVRRKFSRGGKQILLPLFQGGGKKAEKLAKFDKLVNFKAIFGNHQTFAVGFIRVRSEPSIFSNRTIRYRPSIVKKLTNLTTSAVNRKTLKNLKKLPFFGLFSVNLASGRGGTVNFLYSGSFPLTAIN